MLKKNKKNLVIVSAIITVMMVGGIAAYFTSTDTADNTWTVGEIEIDLEEPGYDQYNPEESKDMSPNKVVHKDPKITNTGENEAFVFMKVSIPKANVAVAGQDGEKQEASLQELFDYSITSGWVKVNEDTSDEDANEYVFAYGTEDACTPLAKGASTPVLFSNTVAEGAAQAGAVGFITFKNIIEGQGLENTTLEISVEAYGIQTSDLTVDDVTAPVDVWAIINK